MGSAMQSVREARLWLAWLAKVRILILTLLLGIELALAQFTPVSFPLRLFINAVLLAYTISIFHLALLKFWRELRVQSALQAGPFGGDFARNAVPIVDGKSTAIIGQPWPGSA